MSDTRIVLRVEGRVATLELTGRDDANAMDLLFVEQLDLLVQEVASAVATGHVDVLVLRAEGRHFCVGGDLADFAEASDISAHITRMTAHAHRAIGALHALEIPVVARWQGAAAGGGIGLLLAADIVVAASTATLTAGYSAVGLTPDAGVSWAMPRRVGVARALELLLTNRRVAVDELTDLGLVSRVSTIDGLDTVVDEVVAELLRVDGESARATKRLVRAAATHGLDAHLDVEAGSIAGLARADRFRSRLDRPRGSSDAD
ncbi:MAG: enoyl-CoA hydratase/isomerase family protein [Microbacterium sp.]